MQQYKVITTVFLMLGFGVSAVADQTDVSKDYKYYVTGNPEDVQTDTKGLIVMQGGGTDVDENYVQMGLKGGGGDFVVLRASGDDEYNDYIYELCNCDSVETIVFNNADASRDEFVINKIRNAEALFLAGGDQSNYVRYWRGTAIEDAIHYVAAKPAPIGGTSAGMAIMGEFAYGAMTDESVTSDRALQNPYYDDITLTQDFLLLPQMKNILTDSHFQERDRIGRTLTFMSRLVSDGWTSQAHAIAADRETSLHIDPLTGLARVFATEDHETPFVFFMRTKEKPEQSVPEKPLTIRNIEVYRLGSGGSFNINDWHGEGGISYTLGVENGALVSSRESAY